MLTKYTRVEEILEVKQTSKRLAFNVNPGETFSKFAALKDEIHEDDGYMYVRCRAISSRVNKNNDGWPSEELARAYKSFIGRPVFVDHNNDDPKRTRGVIVDAQLHVDDDEKTSRLDPYYSSAPENHKPPTWIELLIEVDADTFPRLAKEIRTGGIDAVSMGANIEKSVCSVCAHEAATPSEYCDHIKKKGLTFEITADNGQKVRKKSYEDCYGVNFFEISFVFDPADTTALISEKVGKIAAGEEVAVPGAAGLVMNLADDAWMAIHPSTGVDAVASAIQNNDPDAAAKYALKLAENPVMKGELNPWYGKNPDEILATIRTNMPYGVVSKTAVTNPIDFFVEPVGTQHDHDDPNYIPQADQITAPQEVNTLRPEHRCPVCRAADMQTDPDGVERCPTCGHVQEPEPLNNPDLGVARDTDLRQDATDTVDTQGNPEVPVTDGSESVEIAPVSPVAPVAARNSNISSVGISDMEDLFTTQAIETTLGGEYGIHRGTIDGLRGVATTKITFPTVEGDENYVVVPQDNPVFAFFLAQEAAAKLGCKIADVPIVVEVVGGEGDLTKAVEVITTNAAMHPREAAQTKKQPILNTDSKSSDEPKGEKIVSDELTPRETSVKEGDSTVTLQTVQIGDKTYKLTPVDEAEKTPEEHVEEITDPEASEEEEGEEKDSKTADRRHIVRSEQSPDGVTRTEEIVEESGDQKAEAEEQPQAEEVVEEPQTTEYQFASVEDEKEAKLLAAMKIADEAIEMGAVEKHAKMVYIAQLEEKSIETLHAIDDTIALFKAAGLSKSKPLNTLGGLRRVPRLAHTPAPSSNGNSAGEYGTDPDFLWGV